MQSLGLYLQQDQRCGTSHVSLMTAACKLTCKFGAQSVFLFLSFNFLRGSWLAPLSLQTCQPQWAFAPCFWQGVFLSVTTNYIHSRKTEVIETRAVFTNIRAHPKQGQTFTCTLSPVHQWGSGLISYLIRSEISRKREGAALRGGRRRGVLLRGLAVV